jgi:Protein tyrosine and serine/threonine kinase
VFAVLLFCAPTLRPEVFQAGSGSEPKDYDDKADVFSFGVLMYALGARTAYPYEAAYLTPDQVVTAVATRNLRPVVSPSFKLDSAYVSLMERCWSTAASDRPKMCSVAVALCSMLERRRKRDSTASSGGLGWGAWLGR